MKKISERQAQNEHLLMRGMSPKFSREHAAESWRDCTACVDRHKRQNNTVK